MLRYGDVKKAAHGRWYEIAIAMGVGAEYLTGKHTPCMKCKGVDTFRWDQKSERFFCGRSDIMGEDGFGLLQHALGWTVKESFENVAEYLGVKPDASPEAKAQAQENIKKAERVKLEKELLHEITILQIVLTNRVAGRQHSRDNKFLETCPEYKTPPNEHWEREQLAAKKAHGLLRRIYGQKR